MKKLRYYLYVAGWLWRNRRWKNNRAKFKAMVRDYTHFDGTYAERKAQRKAILRKRNNEVAVHENEYI